MLTQQWNWVFLSNPNCSQLQPWKCDERTGSDGTRWTPDIFCPEHEYVPTYRTWIIRLGLQPKGGGGYVKEKKGRKSRDTVPLSWRNLSPDQLGKVVCMWSPPVCAQVRERSGGRSVTLASRSFDRKPSYLHWTGRHLVSTRTASSVCFLQASCLIYKSTPVQYIHLAPYSPDSTPGGKHNFLLVGTLFSWKHHSVISRFFVSLLRDRSRGFQTSSWVVTPEGLNALIHKWAQADGTRRTFFILTV